MLSLAIFGRKVCVLSADPRLLEVDSQYARRQGKPAKAEFDHITHDQGDAGNQACGQHHRDQANGQFRLPRGVGAGKSHRLCCDGRDGNHAEKCSQGKLRQDTALALGTAVAITESASRTTEDTPQIAKHIAQHDQHTVGADADQDGTDGGGDEMINGHCFSIERAVGLQ